MSGQQSFGFSEMFVRFSAHKNDNVPPVTCVVNMESPMKSDENNFLASPGNFPFVKPLSPGSVVRPQCFATPVSEGRVMSSSSPLLSIQVRKLSSMPQSSFSINEPVASSQVMMQRFQTPLGGNLIPIAMSQTIGQSVVISNQDSLSYMDRMNHHDPLQLMQEQTAIRRDLPAIRRDSNKAILPDFAELSENKFQVQTDVISNKYDNFHQEETASLHASAQPWQTGLELFQAQPESAVRGNVWHTSQKERPQQSHGSKHFAPIMPNSVSNREKSLINAATERSIFPRNIMDDLRSLQWRMSHKRTRIKKVDIQVQLSSPSFQPRSSNWEATKAMRNGEKRPWGNSEIQHQIPKFRRRNSKEMVSINLNRSKQLSALISKHSRQDFSRTHDEIGMDAAHNAGDVSRVTPKLNTALTESMEITRGLRREVIESSVPETLIEKRTVPGKGCAENDKEKIADDPPFDKVNVGKGLCKSLQQGNARRFVISDQKKIFGCGSQKILPRKLEKKSKKKSKISSCDFNVPPIKEKSKKKKRRKSESTTRVLKDAVKEFTKHIPKKKSVTIYHQEAASNTGANGMDKSLEKAKTLVSKVNQEKICSFASVTSIVPQGGMTEFLLEEEQKNVDVSTEIVPDNKVEQAHGDVHFSASENSDLVTGSKAVKNTSESNTWCKNIRFVRKKKRRRISSSSDDTDRDEKLGCYVCTHCRKVLNSKIEYQNHLRTHTCIEPITCSLCGRCFTVRSAVKRHIMKDHNCEKLYECSICNRGFIYSKVYQKHMKNVHGNSKPYFCRKCGFNFEDRMILQQHLTSHPEKQHVCNFCDEVYFHRAHLRYHMKDHIGKLDGEMLRTTTTAPASRSRPFKRRSISSKLHLNRNGETLRTTAAVPASRGRPVKRRSISSKLHLNRNGEPLRTTTTAPASRGRPVKRHSISSELHLNRNGEPLRTTTTAPASRGRPVKRHSISSEHQRGSFACNLCTRSYFHRSSYGRHMKEMHTGKRKAVCYNEDLGSKNDEPVESTSSHLNAEETEVPSCSNESQNLELGSCSKSSFIQELNVLPSTVEVSGNISTCFPASTSCSNMQFSKDFLKDRHIQSKSSEISLVSNTPEMQCSQMEYNRMQDLQPNLATRELERVVINECNFLHGAGVKGNNPSFGQKSDPLLKVSASNMQDCSVQISALRLYVCEYCDKQIDSITFKKHGKDGQCLVAENAMECEPNTTVEKKVEELEGNQKRVTRKRVHVEFTEEDQKRCESFLRVHASGKHIYPCLWCQYYFAEEEFLIKHVLKDHARRMSEQNPVDDSKPNECTRSFSANEGMVGHSKIHKKTCYACNVCHIVMNPKSNALRHAQRHCQRRKFIWRSKRRSFSCRASDANC